LLPPHDPHSPRPKFAAFPKVPPLPSLTQDARRAPPKKADRQIDTQLSMTQLALPLGLGITDSAVEKWEKDQNRPTEEHRKRLVEFLGFDPASDNPKGES